MSYKLDKVTIRTNNTTDGIKKIEEVWNDISSGKLPILFDNEHNFLQGISPISEYSNYETDENGDYDFSILGVTSEFFKKIEMEVSKGKYKKYDESDENGDIGVCTKRAWEKFGQNKKQIRLNVHTLEISKVLFQLNIQKMERRIAIFI